MADENRFSRFVSLSRFVMKIDTSVSLAIYFSPFLCSTIHVLSHTSVLTLRYAAPSFEQSVNFTIHRDFRIAASLDPAVFQVSSPVCVGFFSECTDTPQTDMSSYLNIQSVQNKHHCWKAQKKNFEGCAGKLEQDMQPIVSTRQKMTARR